MNGLTSENDAGYDAVKRAVAALGEHFETVQVFVSLQKEDGNTRTINLGSGNWYARYGQIREWLVQAEEQSRSEVWKKDDE